MFSKQQLFDLIFVLLLSAVVFLSCISQMDVGLWEPWETSTLLAVQQMNQANIAEASFWIPQVEGAFVSQPCLELWLLMTILHAFPVPDGMLLRLPGAFVGIFLILLTFWAVRQASTRRTAWMTTAILLTMPMFVLSGKFIHGDIWLIFAVAVPNLFFLLACYASSSRMNRAMLSLTGISVFFSFLSGGLYAFSLLFLEALITGGLLRKHPARKDIFIPIFSRYFLVPLYISFILSGCVFGIYVNQARYALEGRTQITLSELNDALVDDRVISIERRQNQIIGTLRSVGGNLDEQHAFILVESAENWNSNATEIFNLNESEKRAFENYLMWRFQKKSPTKTSQTVPPVDDAFVMAFRYFWYHTNTPYRQSTMPLARVSRTALKNSPEKAWMRVETSSLNSEHEAGSELSVPLHPHELLRILNDEPDMAWVEVQNGNGQHGFVSRDILTDIQEPKNIRWASWLDVLLFGLMPWGCFFPIVFVCALISGQKLCIARSEFKGEFVSVGADAAYNGRSSLQSILLSWVIISIVGLFFGINQSRHDIFVGVIPVAILLAVALTSSRFWTALRESLEARLGLIIAAFAVFGIAVYELHGEPFRLVRYLLTDPKMLWDLATVSAFEQYRANIVYFSIAFGILTLVSFTGAAEAIQEKIVDFRAQFLSPGRDSRNSSSTTLMRVSRGENEPIPYAPAISLVILGMLCAGFIYYSYIPFVSDHVTETAIIKRYFELANKSEPVYLLSGENSQLCLTYHDCEPGYVCQNSHCRISTFASYSLSVARHITRQGMLDELTQEGGNDAFYIIPKDALFGMNQAFRERFPIGTRKNLRVLDAQSSRLYLIGSSETIESLNPFDEKLPAQLPDDATPLTIDLNEFVTVIGFRVDKFEHQPRKRLQLTVYYHLKKAINGRQQFGFSFEFASRNLSFERPVFDEAYDARQLLVGDLVASTQTFELATIPEHGYIDVNIAIKEPNASTNTFRLTTIGY